jgi:hypothetical protein
VLLNRIAVIGKVLVVLLFHDLLSFIIIVLVSKGPEFFVIIFKQVGFVLQLIIVVVLIFLFWGVFSLVLHDFAPVFALQRGQMVVTYGLGCDFYLWAFVGAVLVKAFFITLVVVDAIHDLLVFKLFFFALIIPITSFLLLKPRLTLLKLLNQVLLLLRKRSFKKLSEFVKLTLHLGTLSTRVLQAFSGLRLLLPLALVNVWLCNLLLAGLLGFKGTFESSQTLFKEGLL